MDISKLYNYFNKERIPIEISLNTIFIIQKLIDSYFISFRKFSRKYKLDIYKIIDIITFECNEIKIIKFGEIGILLYHKINIKKFDDLNFKDINNYLNHPKIYQDIKYGIKYSLLLGNCKLYKTVSYDTEEDLKYFSEKIKGLKIEFEKIIKKLNIRQYLEINIETWFSKNYLIDKIYTGLNLKQKEYIIKLLNKSKFTLLSLKIDTNKNLLQLYKSEIAIIISYIKTHCIILRDQEIVNWEKIILEKIIMKDEK
jgi:hypothetical protein